MAKFSFYQYVWIFISGCYLGYGVETLWCLIKLGYIESRKSLVLGHLSVAYGMGAVLLTLLLVHFQNSSAWKIFLVAFVSGTVVEYICSLGQEICFGSGLQPSSAKYKRQSVPFVLTFLGSAWVILGKACYTVYE